MPGAKPVEKATPSELAKNVRALARTRIFGLYAWGASGMTDLSNSRIQAKDDEAVIAIRFRVSQYKYGFTDLLRTIAAGSCGNILHNDSPMHCRGVTAPAYFAIPFMVLHKVLFRQISASEPTNEIVTPDIWRRFSQAPPP